MRLSVRQVRNTFSSRLSPHRLSPVWSSQYLFLFLHSRFFVKDISVTLKNIMFIYGLRVDEDKSYRVIEIWFPADVPPWVYSLFFPSRVLYFFVKNFSATIQARRFIFRVLVDNGLLYCGIENGPFPLILGFSLSLFFLTTLS